MKVLEENKNTREIEGGFPMREHWGPGPGRPMPPHERKRSMRVEFDEGDLDLLKKVFGDEDTAEAAAEIISESPPEIQILAIQLMKMIEEVA